MTPTTAPPGPTPEIVYPESDGKPMAENTKQCAGSRCSTATSAHCSTRDDVFVARTTSGIRSRASRERVRAGRLRGVRPAPGRPGLLQAVARGRRPPHGGLRDPVAGQHARRRWTQVRLLRRARRRGVLRLRPRRNKLDIRIRGQADALPRRRHRPLRQPAAGHPLRDDRTRDDRLTAPTGSDSASSRRRRYVPTTAVKLADANVGRAARLAELGRKARRGQATPEEVAELERLEDESVRTDPPS